MMMNNVELQNAVEVRDACKLYGKKNDQKIVLSHLNMTVSKGSMYDYQNYSIVNFFN